MKGTILYGFGSWKMKNPYDSASVLKHTDLH